MEARIKEQEFVFAHKIIPPEKKRKYTAQAVITRKLGNRPVKVSGKIVAGASRTIFSAATALSLGIKIHEKYSEKGISCSASGHRVSYYTHMVMVVFKDSEDRKFGYRKRVAFSKGVTNNLFGMDLFPNSTLAVSRDSVHILQDE